jgi:Flp pilus assembly protein TadB
MYEPPSDPSARTGSERLTWRRVAVSYAMMAAVPVLLWAASDPLAAGVAVAGGAGAVVATRHARQLARCVEECRGLAVDLPGTVDVTVTWGQRCDAC